ncbi:MAG: radical SAM family heme chaperone HemW [Planctomycetota bacterium]
MHAPALYVHIPFCETKCPYCDFNSFAIEGRDVDGYLGALSRELDLRGVPARPSTVFIGGGTPTVLEPAQIDRYLTDLFARIEPDPEREVTVEANPGSLTAEKLDVLRAHGVNRISIGAQSLFDQHLARIGRVHKAADVEAAYRLARDASFENVSLDFIYAIPGLTLREWASTLDTVISWAPEHLSCYALIFEPGTEFHARRSAGTLRATGERVELAMFRFTERRLRTAGYARYEISNFARPGYECRHNVNYWRNGSYVGFGAGAYSYEGGERSGNARSLASYQDALAAGRLPVVSRERLEPDAALRETVALALRMAEGVDLDEVGVRFGVDAHAKFHGAIRRLTSTGHLEREGRLRLSRRGWRVADTVASEFL